MAKKKNRLKRSADEVSTGDRDAQPTGVADTLARLRNDGAGTSTDQWTQAAGSAAKRQKPNVQPGNADAGSNKPALKIADSHKLNHMLKLQELQALLLYCLADGPAPQWVSVGHASQVQKAVVLMVPGLERAMFNGSLALPEAEDSDVPVDATSLEDAAKESYKPHVSYIAESGPDEYLPAVLDKARLPKSLSPLADVFAQLLPVRAPGDDKFARLFSPLHAMLTSPIPKSHDDKKHDKQSKGAKPANSRQWVNQRTPVTEFLAAKDDLLDNEYVLHPALCSNAEETSQYQARRALGKTSNEDGWVDSLVATLDEGNAMPQDVEQGSITAGRTLLAIDCEMCMVEGDEYALTRISIVGWDGEVVLDEFVLPDKPIVNYLTQYSGITPELLQDVTTSLSDIQAKLLELLQAHTILIGHSLDSDLRALKMTHPFIIDTSILYPHPRGAPLKSSLKWLAQKYLSQEIQKGHGTRGHNSVEDARATLELVKQKCEKGPKWGSSEASTESIFKRLSRMKKRSTSTSGQKNGCIVDRGSGERSFASMAEYRISCEDDAEVVEGVRRAVRGDPDGAYIPGGGVDLTWGRLRDLEALRGWWNDNRRPDRDADQQSAPSPAELSKAVAQTIDHIANIRAFLPPCTLMMVYTGSGDPREMARLQEMHRTYKREYATKKWDELSVKWTDVEEQALRSAVTSARKGLGFVCMS